MAAHALVESMPHDVARSIADPARFCPVLAGAAWLHPHGLKMRTNAGEIEVEADSRVLEHLYALCDGTRSMLEVKAQAPELEDLLDGLVVHGVVVDAALVTLQASSHARQGNPFGRPAHREVTAAVSRRFAADVGAKPVLANARHVVKAPLAALFAARVSATSFAEAPLQEDALLQLAWSIAGVVRSQHEWLGPGVARRTLASAGGMHLLHAYLVLRQPVGGYGRGVFRVLYPDENMVELRFLGDEDDRLAQAFIRPRQVATATGAVFLCADAKIAAMRYRNRAIQFLFMEAGAALHNAALTAPQLGMGFSAIGGYDETAVEALCGLEDKLVLGAGIFGPALATTGPSRP